MLGLCGLTGTPTCANTIFMVRSDRAGVGEAGAGRGVTGEFGRGGSRESRSLRGGVFAAVGGKTKGSGSSGIGSRL